MILTRPENWDAINYNIYTQDVLHPTAAKAALPGFKANFTTIRNCNDFPRH